MGAVYLRIDTVEQALRDLCEIKVEGEGYRIAYRIASDNLGLGNSVVADSCNPIDITRNEWNYVAEEFAGNFLNIEVVCTDKNEHRRRVESRKPEIAGLRLPTWQVVENREYHPWKSNRLIIDTASKSIDRCIAELLEIIKAEENV